MQGIRPGRFHVAPVRMMFAIGLAALALVALAAWQLLSTPWLGLDLAMDERGNVMVERVHDPGPAAGQAFVGDRIVGIRDAEGRWTSLREFDPRLEPHNLSDFASYNDYLARHRKISDALAAGRVIVVTTAGAEIDLTPADSRPLATLPPTFWLFHLFGLIALMISSAVWSFRPGNRAAQLLALSGAGFFLATLFHSIFGSRDPSMDPALLEFSLIANHIAQTVVIGALAVLLAQYPRPATRLPIASMLVPLLVLYQLNEIYQWTDIPPHTFYMPVALLYLVGIGIGVVQWRATTGTPADRAALKWVFLFVFLSLGIGVAVYMVPVMLDLEVPTSPLFLVAFASLVYVGFALGVLRYRLFELERWWFMAWLWFLSGLTIVAVDIALVLLLGLGPIEALWVAILIAAWLYFPLRQWVWRRIVNYTESDLNREMPRLMQRLFTAESGDEADQIWLETLDSLFQPLELRDTMERAAEPRLDDEGATLIAPTISAGGALAMHYAMKGNRLFSQRDVNSVRDLMEVGRQAFELRMAEAEGVRREQARIMRDLHDDVGGRVLTLIHSASTPRQAELARRALSALRDSIRALDNRERISLRDLLQQWQEDAGERLGQIGARFEPRGVKDLPENVELGTRHQINLRRILDEAITNMVRHASPECCRFRVSYQDGLLRLELCNDGVTPPEDGQRSLPKGRGLHNIQTRASELSGSAEVGIEKIDGKYEFRVRVELPIR